MIRLLARFALTLLANAVGLILAATFVSGFKINSLSFLIALLVFTLVEFVAGPLLLKISIRNVPQLTGGIALVTTFVGLLFTATFTDGLEINGLSAWILSTLIVWLCALLASLVLPLFIFKKTLENHRN